MIKAILFLGVVAAALIVGGVLEVKINPGELSKVPARIMAVASDTTTQEKGRSLVTQAKRTIERYAIKDEKKQLALALLYVKKDAERLEELAQDHGDNAAALLPQAQLLAKSVEQARKQGGSASLELITTLREQSRESFAAARTALTTVNQRRDQYEALKENFARVSQSLEEQLADTGLPGGEKVGEVAGSSTVPGATPSPISTPPTIQGVPLNF